MTDATGTTGYGHLQLALFVDGSLLSGLVLAQMIQLKRELGIRHIFRSDHRALAAPHSRRRG